ncbi:MAG: transposase [Balneola sp.]|jgi:putative transposase
MRQNKLHDRQSMRLQGYDYSRPGFYFITICAQNMEHIFGDIIGGKMQLNECGEIAWHYWNTIENRYPNTHVDEFIIMPNHVHGIIEIVNENPFVGAIHESPLRTEINTELYRKNRRKMLIPKIIGWYKMNTAKQINQVRQTPGQKSWQRNYYDHIIRNEESLFHIREYIKHNPENWNKDRFHINR